MTVEELYKKQQEQYKSQSEKSTTSNANRTAINKTTTNTTSTSSSDSSGLGNFISNIFKSSKVFDDGYDFGDVTKSVLATAASSAAHVVKGIASIGEGIVDKVRYGISDIAKKASTSATGYIDPKIYKYSKEVKERAQEDTLGQLTDTPLKWLDDYSWIGTSGQSIAEGVGYSLGMYSTGQALGGAGLSSTATSVATTGITYQVASANAMTEAYQAGATDDEAKTYGILAGTSEAASELLFGALSGTTKVLGITKSAVPLDEWTANKLSSLVPAQFAKTKYGVRLLTEAAFEGAEEVISGYFTGISKYVTYQTYDKGYNLQDILKNEDLLSQFVAGAISSGVLQGAINTSVYRKANAINSTDINIETMSTNEKIIKQVNDEIYGKNINISKDGIIAMDVDDINLEINNIDKVLYESNINELTPERVQELQTRKNELLNQRNNKYSNMSDNGKTLSKKRLDNKVKDTIKQNITTPKTIDTMEELNQVNASIDNKSTIPTAQNTTNIDLNSEQLKQTAKEYIDSINKQLGDSEQIQVVENLTPQQKSIEDMCRAFGKQVVFISNSEVSGLTVGDKVPNVLYVDVDAKTASYKGNKNNSLLYTAWHELFHSLDEELKNEIVNNLKENITNEQVTTFISTYDPMDTQKLLHDVMIDGQVDVQEIREHPTKYISQSTALDNICEEIAANEFGSMMTDVQYMNNLSNQDSKLYNDVVLTLQKSFKSLNKSIYNSSLTQLQINDLRDDFTSVVEMVNSESVSKKVEITKTAPIKVDKTTEKSQLVNQKNETAPMSVEKSVEKSKTSSAIKEPTVAKKNVREEKNFERLTLEEQDAKQGIIWTEEDKAYVEKLIQKQKQAEKEELQLKKRQKEQLEERKKLIKKQEQVLQEIATLPTKTTEEVKVTKMNPETVLTLLEQNLQNYESGKVKVKSSATYHVLTDGEKAALLSTMTKQYENYKKLGGTKVIDLLETQIQVINQEQEAEKGNFKDNLKKILGNNVKALPKVVDTELRGVFTHDDYINDSLKEILDSYNKEDKFYQKGSHEQYKEEAQRIRELIDHGGASEYVKDVISTDRNLTPVDNALIVNLTNDLSTNGHKDLANALITKMVEQGTKNAQYIESMKLFEFEKLNPTAKATYVGKQYEKAAQKINSEIDANTDTTTKHTTKKTNRVRESLTPEELSFIEDAYNKAEQETNPIRKEIYEARIAQYLGNALDSSNVSFDMKLKAWRDLALLGNFKTQGKNLMSNAFVKPVNKIADYIADRFGQTLTNKLLAEGSKKTGFDTSNVGKTSYGKEITKSTLNKMLESGQISKQTYDGIMEVWTGIKVDADNINSAIPNSIQKRLPKKVQNMLVNEGKTLSQDAMKFGVIESILGTKAGVRSTEGLARWDIEDSEFAPTTKIFNENRTENTNLNKVLNKVGKFLNRASTINYGVLEASDAGYERMYYYDRLVELMLTNNVSEPTEWMKELAKGEAQKRTWKNDGKFAKTINGIRNAFNNITIGTNKRHIGLGDLLMPYVTSTANISVALYDYSPLAYMSVVKSAIELNEAMIDGNTQGVREAQFNFQNTFGKASAGTLLYIVAAALAGAGVLTGDEPDDEKAKEVLKATGWQKYSIKIGNTYWSYDWTEPVGKNVALAVDLYQDLVKTVNGEDDGTNGLQTILKAANKLGSTMYEDSPLSSFSNLLTSYTYNEDPSNLVIDFVGNTLTQFLPTLGQQLADMLDPTSKVIYESDHPFVTMKNKLLAKIPFAKSLLATKKTTLGETAYKYPTGYSWYMSPFNSFLALGNVSVDTDNAVAEEFARLYSETGKSEYMPYRVTNSTIKGLSKADQQKLQESIGKTTTEIMTTLMSTTAYKTADIEAQGKAVEAMIDYAKGKAIYESGFKEDYELSGKAKQLLEIVNNGISEENAAIYVGFISTLKGENGGQAKNGSKAYAIMNLNISDTDKNQLLYVLADYKENKAETVESLSTLTTEQEYIDYYALPKTDYTKIENISREDYNLASKYYGFDSGSFTKYASELSELKSDYDNLGNTIPNSKKTKILKYVNSLSITMPQKIFLIHMMGYSVTNYKSYMLSYINSLNISNSEKRELYINLGYTS